MWNMLESNKDFSPVEDRGNYFKLSCWTQASSHHPSLGFSPEATWMAPHLCHEQGNFNWNVWCCFSFDICNHYKYQLGDRVYISMWVIECWNCFHLGCRGAGNPSNESIWSSNILYNVPASARGKILHSGLHNNTLHALQLRQHLGGHPNQAG